MKGLIDSTLREGRQTAGVSFSLVDRKRILLHLLRIGLEEIELGTATPYDHDLAALLHYGRNLGRQSRFALWCPCRPANLDFALKLRPEVLSLSIPGSAILIRKKLDRDADWVLATAKQSIDYARQGGCPYISLGIEDATRTEAAFLKELILTAAGAGAARIRLADTVGIAAPLELAALVRTVRSYFQGDLGVHLHNDFGMATANSLAALEAGADYADVTSLGLGERAGNARLEEVAGFLALRKGRPYQTTALKPLAELLAKLTGRKIDQARPVIGAAIFHCESGLHLQGLQKDPATYEPYGPEKVGARRKLLYGAKIGKRQIKDGLAAAGLQPPFRQLEKLVQEVRQAAAQLNRPLPPAEFTALISAIRHRL